MVRWGRKTSKEKRRVKSSPLDSPHLEAEPHSPEGVRGVPNKGDLNLEKGKKRGFKRRFNTDRGPSDGIVTAGRIALPTLLKRKENTRSKSNFRRCSS